MEHSVLLAAAFGAVAAFRVGLVRFATHGLPLIVGADEAFHANLIRAVRAAGHRGVTRIPGYGMMKRQVYPWGYHWLLSFVPPSRLAAVGVLFGTATDLLLLAATIAFLWLVVGMPNTGELGWLFAAFAGTPLLTRERTGKLTLRERPLGMLLVGLSFLLLLAHHVTGSWLSFGVAVLLASLIPVTSKFGNQALFGHAVIAGFVLGHPSWVGLPLLSFTLAWAWSRGEALEVLCGQARHLRLFWTDIYAGFATVRDRYRVRDAFRPASFRTRRRRVGKLLRRHPLTVLLLGLPLLPLVVYEGLQGSAQSDPLRGACLAWLGASGLLFVATSIGRLRILGQAERYFDASIPAYLILAAGLLGTGFDALGAALVVLGVSLSVHGFFTQRKTLAASTAIAQDVREAMAWLESRRPRARILTVPINWANYAVAFSEGEVCDALGVLMEGDPECFRWLIESYPWPVRDLPKLVREARIEAVVARRHPRVEEYDWSAFSEVYSNRSCRVYLPAEQEVRKPTTSEATRSRCSLESSG